MAIVRYFTLTGGTRFSVDVPARANDTILLEYSDDPAATTGTEVPPSDYTLLGVGERSTGFEIEWPGAPSSGRLIVTINPYHDRITNFTTVQTITPVALDREFDQIHSILDSNETTMNDLQSQIDAGMNLALLQPADGLPFDAEGVRIENVADPLNTQDAATKNYVDQAVSNAAGGATLPPIGAGQVGKFLVATNDNPDTADWLDIPANSIGSSQIQNDAIQTSHIQDGAVTGAKIGTNEVGIVQLAEPAVDTVNIYDGAVTQPKLASNAVATGNIIDGQVTTPKLADGAVTNSKISNNAVTLGKIAFNVYTLNVTISSNGWQFHSVTIGNESLVIPVVRGSWSLFGGVDPDVVVSAPIVYTQVTVRKAGVWIRRVGTQTEDVTIDFYAL